MTLRRTFDSFISQPAIYKFQTRILGRGKLDDEMRIVVSKVCENLQPGIVADVGGGTAQTRELWPDSWRYISIDPDERMTQLNDKQSIERKIGSAGELPFEDGSVDVVLTQNTSHHLDDETWKAFLDETLRVLKPHGVLLFMDAVLNKSRHISNIFWKFDAGHFQRTASELEESIAGTFVITETRRMTLIHDVLTVTATKP
jgi:SAM-dependent methyltransferase